MPYKPAAPRKEIVEKDNVFGYWTPGALDKMIRRILVPVGGDRDKRVENPCVMAEDWTEKRGKRKA